MTPKREATLEDFNQFRTALDEFGRGIMSGCEKILDAVPNTVHTVCDLLIAVSQRNGKEWRVDIMQKLVSQVNCFANSILNSELLIFD